MHARTLPFNSLFSRTALVCRYQKGRTILEFTEARDDRVALASAGPYADHLHLDPDRQPHQHLITQFLQAGCYVHEVKTAGLLFTVIVFIVL